jgi:hypothetical protein
MQNAKLGKMQNSAKRRRQEEGGFSTDSHEDLFPLLPADEANPPCSNDARVSREPQGSSRVSGTQEEALMQSLLLTEDALERYLTAEQKLQVELKNVCMEDHIWYLKSMDQNKVAVVKLHCGECGKDFGSVAGDHSKGTVHNLFTNFKKSHVVSTSHIKNWCRRKGVRFEDHPQSQAARGKPVVLTLANYKHLVLKGIEIMDAMNASIGDDQKPFVVIGDLESDELQSFLFRVKCNACRDYFVFCPPRKNLEANLRNHVISLKHIKAVDDL